MRALGAAGADPVTDSFYIFYINASEGVQLER